MVLISDSGFHAVLLFQSSDRERNIFEKLEHYHFFDHAH